MGSIESFVQRHDYKGRILGGVYHLDFFLGHGGFGEVWRATDTRDGKPVAVKMLPAGVDKTGKSLKQLEHECRMLMNLSHPNICRMLDFIHDKEVGVALVTEFVDGTDIYTASTPATSGRYIVQLLQALSYLHGKNVYHFDIKPGNVLVTNGMVKLIDFGLASLFPEQRKSGTPSYMAPEIFADSGKKDARTELYAVGVLWLCCLTRTNPFRSVSIKDAEQKHLTWEPTQALEKMPAGKAIIKLLKVNPDERFQRVSDLLEALQLIVEGGVSFTAEIASAYGSAGGKFVGRGKIVTQVLEGLHSASSGNARWMAVVGERGIGKSRLLNQCKLKAQVGGCRTIDINSADKITLESIKPLADSLADPSLPLLLVLDDYDTWMNMLSAEPLRQLLDVLRNHPHPPTPVLCLISCATPAQVPAFFDAVQMEPFSEEEVAQFIDGVATLPPAKRRDLAARLWQRTGGSPLLLTRVLSAITQQGVLVSESGSWDECLFEDISIDIPEYSVDPGAIVQESPEEIWELSHADRDAGHPLRALDRLLNYPRLTEKLLLEAVECAISTGKVKEVIALIQGNVERMSDKGRLLYQLGILHMVQNDHHSARSVVLSALEHAGGDESLALSIRNQLARCDLLQRDYSKAIAQFRETRRAESALGDGSVVLNNELGHALLRDGQHEEALAILEEDIQKYKRAGHVRRLLKTLMWRGEAQGHLAAKGKVSRQDVRQGYEHVIEMAREYQELKVLGEAYSVLADIMLNQGDLNHAMSLYRKALSLHYTLHQLPDAAVITNNMGLCFLTQGQLQDARYRFETAMEFLKDAPGAWRGNLTQSFLCMAEIYRLEERFHDANAMLDQADDVAKSTNEWNKHAYSLLMTRAQVRQMEKNEDEAREFAEQAEPFAVSDPQRKEWQEFMMNYIHFPR